MKTYRTIITLLLAFVGLTACEHPSVEPGVVENEDVQRTVIYTVDGKEDSKTMKSDAEWDALLDQFCNSAEQGAQVAFYSMGGPRSQAKGVSKEKTTFTTTSRDEIKAWMKAMEKEGKTVNVNYNEETGVWSGVAYAGVGNQNVPEGQEYTGALVQADMPALDGAASGSKAWALQVGDDSTLYLAVGGYLLATAYAVDDYGFDMAEGVVLMLYGSVSAHTDLQGNGYLVLDLSTVDQAALAGTWQLMELTKTVMTIAGGNPTVEVYWWNTDGVSAYYTLAADGSASYKQGSESQSGSWSLTGGTLCCDLFEGGECWEVNWFSSESIVLSREEAAGSEGDTYYNMWLSADGEAKK